MPGTIQGPKNSANEQQLISTKRQNPFPNGACSLIGGGQTKSKICSTYLAMAKIKQRKECWSGVGVSDLNRVISV